MRRAAVAACVLALACAALNANAAGSAVAALGCGAGDCCYSGTTTAQRFCACADAFRRSKALTACATVRCAAGPPPGVCEKLLAVPPAPATEASDCVCTKEYAPVCVGGKTFSNVCEVRRHCSRNAVSLTNDDIMPLLSTGALRWHTGWHHTRRVLSPLHRL